MNSSTEKTTALEEFVGVPIAIQLTNPIASHASCEEVEVSEGQKCGVASPVQIQAVGPDGKPAVGPDGKPQLIPVTVQLLKGEIVEVGSVGIRFSYTAVDGNTPKQTFFPFNRIDAVHFAVKHIPAPPPKAPSLIIQN